MRKSDRDRPDRSERERRPGDREGPVTPGVAKRAGTEGERRHKTEQAGRRNGTGLDRLLQTGGADGLRQRLQRAGRGAAFSGPVTFDYRNVSFLCRAVAALDHTRPCRAVLASTSRLLLEPWPDPGGLGTGRAGSLAPVHVARAESAPACTGPRKARRTRLNHRATW